MMRFSAFAVSILLALAAFAPPMAYAAEKLTPPNGLTRIGNLVGVKNMPVVGSLEDSMNQVGIPKICRDEAHILLAKYLAYGYDDHADWKPHLTILCNAELSSVPQKEGKTIGKRVRVTGLAYIRFINVNKDIERYMVHRDNPKQVLACTDQGNCINIREGGRVTAVDTTKGPIYMMVPKAKPKKELLKKEASKDKTSSHEKRGGGKYAFMKLFGVGPKDIVNVVQTSILDPACRLGSTAVTSLTGGVGSVTSCRGTRVNCGQCSHNHQGVDQSAACGTNINAAQNGVVAWVGQYSNGNNVVAVAHGNGTFTEYLHMQSRSPLAVGSQVTAGQVIGRVGNTGTSSVGTSAGCHLHFQAFTCAGGTYCQPRSPQRSYLNPVQWVAQRGNVTPLTPTEFASLGANIGAAQRVVLQLPNVGGGAAGEMDQGCLDGTVSCATGSSVDRSVGSDTEDVR